MELMEKYAYLLMLKKLFIENYILIIGKKEKKIYVKISLIKI